MTKPLSKLQKTLRRTAPPYRRLDPDHYASLDELEKTRHDLHLDIDAIIDAVPYAQLDARATGFRPGRGYDTTGGRSSSVRCDQCHGIDSETCTECGGTGAVPTTSEYSDPTSTLAFHQNNHTAAEWLTERTEATKQLVRVARLARYFYGFDPDRGRDNPDRPQPRSRTCAYCGKEAPEGRGPDGKPLVRLIDQKPIHTSPCYWTAASQAQKQGISIGAHLANLANNKTAGASPDRTQCG